MGISGAIFDAVPKTPRVALKENGSAVDVGLNLASTVNVPGASFAKELWTGFSSEEGFVGHVQALTKMARDIVGVTASYITVSEGFSTIAKSLAGYSGALTGAVVAIDAWNRASDWAEHHQNTGNVAADNLAREIREANSSYREKTAFTPYDPTPSSDASGVTAAFANIPHAAEDAYHYFRSLFASADKADSQPVAQAPEINANQNTAADSPGRVSGSPSSPDASVRDFSHYKSRMDRRRETLKNDHAKDLPLAAAEPQPSENTPTPNPTKCRQEAAQARKDLIDKGVTPAQAESTITKDLEAAKTDPHRFPNCRKYFGHSAPSV